MEATTDWRRQRIGGDNGLEATTDWRRQGIGGDNGLEATTDWRRQRIGGDNGLEATTEGFSIMCRNGKNGKATREDGGKGEGGGDVRQRVRFAFRVVYQTDRPLHHKNEPEPKSQMTRWVRCTISGIQYPVYGVRCTVYGEVRVRMYHREEKKAVGLIHDETNTRQTRQLQTTLYRG